MAIALVLYGYAILLVLISANGMSGDIRRGVINDEQVYTRVACDSIMALALTHNDCYVTVNCSGARVEKITTKDRKINIEYAGKHSFSNSATYSFTIPSPCGVPTVHSKAVGMRFYDKGELFDETLIRLSRLDGKIAYEDRINVTKKIPIVSNDQFYAGIDSGLNDYSGESEVSPLKLIYRKLYGSPK